METLVVNFYGGPGSGKSTMAAGLFERLKWAGINCELATEYAKDKTWEESFKVLDSQLYVLGKQYQRLFRLKDKVDVIITDSPLLLSTIYNKQFSKTFDEFVLEAFNSFNNTNYFVSRCKDYNPKGRTQTLEEAKVIDQNIFELLNTYKLSYNIVEGVKESVDGIAAEILKKLGR